MFPLRDNLPSRTTPYVVWALVVLNAAVFFHQISLPEEEALRFAHRFGAVPSLLLPSLAIGPSPSWIPLLTSPYLHGGWLHLLGNLWFLWVFGDNVEDRLGHGRFLAFYSVSGALAVLAHSAVEPSSSLPLIGASGGVAGVLGAYLVLYPRAQVRTLLPLFIFIQIVDLPASLFLGLWFGVQMLSGWWAVAGGADPVGVAFWAHIGGFVVGVAVGIFLRGTRGARGGRIRPSARQSPW